MYTVLQLHARMDAHFMGHDIQYPRDRKHSLISLAKKIKELHSIIPSHHHSAHLGN